ncbi:MAG: hypothetical protein ACLFSQ_09965 [Candidatus Zixiibacteriota bacterium]
MKSLSLKLDNEIFEETEKLVKSGKISRNRYINNALKYYNQQKSREILAEKLKAESRIIKKYFMKVLGESESLEDHD